RVKNGHRQTSYFVSFNGNYQINGLKLYVSSPTYYHRQIAVYDLDHRPEEKLCNDSISSSGEPGNGISLSCKISKLRIDINNGDDNPIVIDSISAWQVQQYAISYLEKGHRYYLLTGDSSADEVSYDLSFLHSRPMAKFPVINYSAVYKNPLFAIHQFPGRRNYTVLIWITITIVLLLLGLLTWRMVNEINQKPKI
ncbi:MAG TPA: hypothetical protein VHC47_05740, partial [Mucilaginibacter sp.]|nr:hypothetical protein [Mucilaginibacter sp.]